MKSTKAPASRPPVPTTPPSRPSRVNRPPQCGGGSETLPPRIADSFQTRAEDRRRIRRRQTGSRTQTRPKARPKAKPAVKAGSQAGGAQPRNRRLKERSARGQEAGPKTASAPPSRNRRPRLRPEPAKPAKKGAWFEFSTKTPKQSQFRMPAEWETHFGTFLTWPNKKGISFPGKGAFEAALPAFESMLRALIASEQVFINVASDEDKQVIRDLLTIAEQSRIHFIDTPSMEPWCRDHGAHVCRPRGRQGRGLDRLEIQFVGPEIRQGQCRRRHCPPHGGVSWRPLFDPGLVLEGGAIEVNGSGTVLTTESCLLNKNRNKGVKKEDMERLLKDFLGVTNVLWLPAGLEGDDTDGHIDTITRFVNKNTVLTVRRG